MAFSTSESWNRYKMSEDQLKDNGQEDILKDRVRKRIQLVLDSVVGKRTFRNLWGVNPVRSQDLFWWDNGGGLFGQSMIVGGKRLDIYSEQGELGENLVWEVAQELGALEVFKDEQAGLDKPTVTHTSYYRSPSGIEFHRASFRVNRRIFVDQEHEEFVPGFPPTYAISLRAVFPAINA